MSYHELDMPVVLKEKQGEVFSVRFMLSATKDIPAPDSNSFMDEIRFRETATAQLARSLSTHSFSELEEAALQRKFHEFYNLPQEIADIHTYLHSSTPHDINMSGSGNLAFVYPDAPTPTGKARIHTAMFHPFTLDFLEVDQESSELQNEQFRHIFPNLNTKNPIHFLSPIVVMSYPVTFQTYGLSTRSKYGPLEATIVTASARYVKKQNTHLIDGVHTRTVRTDFKATEKEIDFLLRLSTQLAHDRAYNAQTDGVIYNDTSGNSK